MEGKINMKISKAIILLLFFSFTMVLSSCASKTKIEDIIPAKTIHFSWWGKDLRINYTINAISDFEKLNPDIDIIPEYGEWTGFQKRMYIELSSNTEADVMQINYDWLHKNSPNGYGFFNLKNLSEYINLDNFSAEDLKYGTIDGKLNGIPIALNAQTLFLNKTIYDHYKLSLPKTWDDLFHAAQVMSKDKVYPLELNEKSMWLLLIAHEEQLTGISFIDSNDNFAFSQNSIKNMLAFYKELIDKKVIKPVNEVGKNDFENGISAGAVYWISDAEYSCVPAIENGYDIVVGDYITMNNAKRFGWYAKPTALYAIKRTTKNPKDAAKLVEFLLNSEEMIAQQKLEKGVPLSKSALEILEAKDLLKGIQYDANQKLFDNPDSLECINPKMEDTQLIDEFQSAFEEVYYNNSDITEVSKKLLNNIKEILTND